MAGSKAASKPASAGSSQASFVSHLPSVSDASASIHRYVGPQMGVWHAISHTESVLKRAFTTEEGRELVRKGADYAKTAFDSVPVGLDKLAKVASQEHKYGKGLAGIEAYGQYIKQVTQDVIRVKSDYRLAEMAARSGHKAAASMQVFLKDPLRETEAVLERETTTLLQYYRLAEHGGAGVSGKLGKLAYEGEKLLGGSEIGKQIIGAKSWWKHSGLESSLNVVGTVMDISKTWDTTKGVSTRGRATAAAMGGVASYAPARLMPQLGVLDLGIKAAGAAMGAKSEQVEGFTFSKWAQGTANQYFQLGRAILHRDSAPINELHRANMAGENGRVLQGYAMIGEKLSKTAAMDGVLDCAVAVNDGVSRGYTKSLQWWRSLQH